MVVRLVKQQQVGLDHEELGDPQQLLLAAAQGVGDKGKVGGCAKTQPVQCSAHPTLIAGTAQFGVALYQARLFFERVRQGSLVGVDDWVGQALLAAVQGGVHRRQVGRGCQRLFPYRAPGGQARLLPQIADREPGLADHEAGVGAHLARKQAQQRALPGAIGPHQPDAAVVVDFPRKIEEDWFGYIGDADGIEMNGNHGGVSG